MYRKIFTASLMLASSAAFAGGNVGWNKITSIAFQSNDLMLYADNWSNPNNCQLSNGVILKRSDVNFDKAYALLLAAFMAGKEVYAYSDGCHTFDEKTYNYIRGTKYLQVK